VRVLRTSSKSWWSSVTHSIGRAMHVDLSPTTRAQTIQVGTMAIVAPAIWAPNSRRMETRFWPLIHRRTWTPRTRSAPQVWMVRTMRQI
jgi:hypothetical protein